MFVSDNLSCFFYVQSTFSISNIIFVIFVDDVVNINQILVPISVFVFSVFPQLVTLSFIIFFFLTSQNPSFKKAIFEKTCKQCVPKSTVKIIF